MHTTSTWREHVRTFGVPFILTLAASYSAGGLLLWVKLANLDPETDTLGDAADVAAAMWVYWLVFGLVVSSFPASLTGLAALFFRHQSRRPGPWTAAVGTLCVAALCAVIWSS